ncbi:MAG: GGDEF domain-containing protein [Gammaproteobacteria bacterium]|nr:GGDEF domain-containing protein [Gammaproteobacteria bacterium]
MTMVVNQQRLQKRALRDLSKRAKGGIFIYVLVWLIIAISHQLPDVLPVLFYFNMSILLAVAGVRILHLYMHTRSSELSVSFMTDWLVYTILFAAIHWGLMVAWILFDDKAVDVHNLMIVATAGIAIGGATTLSISTRIRIFYPVLMFCPGILVLIYQGSSEGTILASLIALALIFVHGTTKITNGDYWEAITNQIVAEDRANLMEQLSITDQLTQLKNRLYFDKKFDQEWNRCSRMEIPLSVLLMDIDNFKEINDTYGHLFGDECLQLIASTISSELLRASDCVARYGGEEFVALLPNTAEPETRAIADKLVRAVSAVSSKLEGKKIQITCSIGGATTSPNYQEDKEFLIKQADIALYQAKNNGRNQYQPFIMESSAAI